MFSRARQQLYVFPRLSPVILFRALGTGCTFSRNSRAWYQLHVFASSPGTSYMFLLRVSDWFVALFVFVVIGRKSTLNVIDQSEFETQLCERRQAREKSVKFWFLLLIGREDKAKNPSLWLVNYCTVYKLKNQSKAQPEIRSKIKVTQWTFHVIWLGKSSEWQSKKRPQYTNERKICVWVLHSKLACKEVADSCSLPEKKKQKLRSTVL